MLLITGATGFVGRHLVSALEDYSPAAPAPGIRYFAIGGPGSVGQPGSADLSNPFEVARLFRQHEFDGIIHLAAESRTGICQESPATALQANTTATRNLLQAAAPHGAWFLYVSTDMVFSGDKGRYIETDIPNPINEYGRSKALAEASVQLYPGKWCIVRPALIYGASIGGRNSMLSWTLQTLQTGGGTFFEDEIRTPVWVNDLVNLLVSLYRNRHEGIVHAGGPDVVSRYQFAQLTAATWGTGETNLKAGRLSDLDDVSWRPRDLSLISNVAGTLKRFTPVKEALVKIRDSGVL